MLKISLILDTGSEGKGDGEVSENEEQTSTYDRLQQNLANLDTQKFNWKVKTQSRNTTDVTPVCLIIQPTASKLSHRLLTA
jgi:hypothetical protein